MQLNLATIILDGAPAAQGGLLGPGSGGIIIDVSTGRYFCGDVFSSSCAPPVEKNKRKQRNSPMV